MFYSLAPRSRMTCGRSGHPLPASGARGLSAVFLILAILLFQPARAYAQAHEFLGDWQQLTSDAGACARCQLSFSGGSSQLSVVANNGWSAVVDARETATDPVAAGGGRWGAIGGAFASKPFTVEFSLRGERLYMTMVNDLGNGRKRIIRGVFGRPWVGA